MDRPLPRKCQVHFFGKHWFISNLRCLYRGWLCAKSSTSYPVFNALNHFFRSVKNRYPARGSFGLMVPSKSQSLSLRQIRVSNLHKYFEIIGCPVKCTTINDIVIEYIPTAVMRATSRLLVRLSYLRSGASDFVQMMPF